MKLHELGAPRQTNQITQVLESRLGSRLEIDRLTARQARTMLDKVGSLLREHRSQHQFHHSERDPSYLKLVMMQQALQQYIAEQTNTMQAIDVNNPQTKATLNRAIGKAARGQVLTPDEQKAVTAVAMLKKESQRPRRMVKESEIQQAQVVLAAQDMIDRLQKMTEELSEMQFKDLPALTDSIKNDMGTEQASAFQTSASAALNELLAAVQQGKGQMEQAQSALTGQEPVVPGASDLDMDADVMPTDDTEVDVDLDLDSEESDSDEALGATLGRERR